MSSNERKMLENYLELKEEMQAMREEIASIRKESGLSNESGSVPASRGLNTDVSDQTKSGSSSLNGDSAHQDLNRWKDQDRRVKADLESMHNMVTHLQLLMRHYAIKSTKLALSSPDLEPTERSQRLELMDKIESQFQSDLSSCKHVGDQENLIRRDMWTVPVDDLPLEGQVALERSRPDADTAQPSVNTNTPSWWSQGMQARVVGGATG